MEVGQNYLLKLMSQMNSKRLSTNKPKINLTEKPGTDIFSYPPIYEFGPNGEIKVISNGHTVTDAKFYMLIPNIINEFNRSNFNTNLNLNLLKPLYLTNKKELCDFFGLSDATIYKSINKGLPLTNKTTGITYTITKIY